MLERIENIKDFDDENLLRTDNLGDIRFSSVEGSLKFSYEKFDESEKLTLSWIEFSLTLFIIFGIIVVFIKPKKRKPI